MQPVQKGVRRLIMAIQQKKHEMPTQAPEVRAHNFDEVAQGYSLEIAVEEQR